MQKVAAGVLAGGCGKRQRYARESERVAISRPTMIIASSWAGRRASIVVQGRADGMPFKRKQLDQAIVIRPGSIAM